MESLGEQTILSEERLRAYLRCSQYFKYDGVENGDHLYQMVKRTFKTHVSSSVRQSHMDPTFLLTKAIQAAQKSLKLKNNLMDQQVAQLERSTLNMMNQIFLNFPTKKYLLVSPPHPFRTKISRTPIDLVIPAIYRSTRNQTLHFIDFVPYSNSHSVEWDIPINIKISYLKDYIPFAPAKRISDVTAHVFGITESMTDIKYSKIQNANVNLTNRILDVVQSIERDYHFPITPCPYACQFKTICKP